MKRQITQLFARHFFVALLILLLFKLGLFVNNTLGTEGYVSGWNLASKALLLLGRDVLGAAVFAVLMVVLCLPFVRRDIPRATLLVSLFGQGAHALFVAVSFFVNIYLGGPLNKAVLDLAQFDSLSQAAAGQSALWSSIQHYLGPFQITVFVVAVGLAIAAFLRLPWLAERVSRRTAKIVVGCLALEMMVTVFLLPWLINGHLWGIRVHTYGLEKSAGVALVWSYTKPLFTHTWAGNKPSAEGGFRFDHPMITPRAEPVDNPLRRAAPKKTNVILISLESIGNIYIEEDPQRMPFLSGIGQSEGGVYLASHYSVWPQTMKAFFSVFCSELPYPYYQPITTINPAIPCVSLSETLHAHGYNTALITSADLAYDRKKRFFNHRKFNLMLDMRNMPGKETVWGDSWGLDERIAVKNILDFARRNGDHPFFVFYEMITAHHPYNACQEHVDNPLGDDFEQYKRALGYIDDRIRELAEGLAENGQLDNTLIVAFADHGEGFSQHPGSISHGPKVYQEVIHVPAVAFGPQLAEVSGTLTLPTSHIDIAPTILGLLGIEVPCTMKGRNLVISSEQRLVFFAGRPPGGQRGLVDGRWKYILEEDSAEYLFDLDADHLERHNLVAQHPALAEQYRGRLGDWRDYSENLIEHYAEILAHSPCRAR